MLALPFIMSLETVIKYPAVFLSGLVVALVITSLWRRVAPLLKLVDHPGERKIHKQTIPLGGGVAVFLGFHAACAVVFLLPWKPFAGQIQIDWWFRFLPLSFGVVLLGLLDDRCGMRPMVKLAAQTALALAAYSLHIRIQNVMGMNLPEWVDFCGTVIWFLAIMNSFNLIDGVDGLAAGIALIASVGIGTSPVFRSSPGGLLLFPGDVLLFAGFAGACLGFLRYNYYPASVFLGDTGSLFIGFTLAALTISTSSKGTAVAAIGMPLLAVGVPLFDTVLAIWRRSVRRLLASDSGGAPVEIDQGDADHLHHRLLRQGRKHDQVAWLFYIATALLAFTGILTTVFNDRILGILGLAFVLTSYIVFRHLAWVELRDTGEVIMRGIARPVRRNLSLLFYILADIVILNAAWFSAVILIRLYDGSGLLHLESLWLSAVPVDVVIPFLVLLGFRSYTRVWSLAGVTEYSAVGAAVVIGGAAACGVELLFGPAGGAPWKQILHHVVMISFAVPGIVGIRAVLRAVQDLMHRRAGPDHGSRPRALVFGEGPSIMLYLRHRLAANNPLHETEIAGLVSSDDALCGHFISGFQVLGHMQDIPALIRQKNIDRFYVAGPVSDPQMAELKNQLSRSRVQMIHWAATEAPINLCVESTADG